MRPAYVPFWQRKAKATTEDPVFGRLVLDEGEWQATVAIPGESADVLVAVSSGPDPPSELQRRAFRRLLADLPGLSEQISDALFELYRPNQEAAGWQGPRAESPPALRSLLELSNVRISRDTAVELLYAFRGDSWPDAMLVLSIDDGAVRAVTLDD